MQRTFSVTLQYFKEDRGKGQKKNKNRNQVIHSIVGNVNLFLSYSKGKSDTLYKMVQRYCKIFNYKEKGRLGNLFWVV